MSKIGIVTVLYNSESVLEEFFKTLNEQTFKDFTLYIVDNASSDNSLQKAHELANIVSFPCVFFEEKKNWGIAVGNNIGINAAINDGVEYILLSNNDIVLNNDDTILRLIDKMDISNIGILCPKIYYYDNPKLIWAAGGDFFRMDTSTIHFGAKQEDKGQFDKEIQIRYTPTCFVLIKVDVFKQIGIMDDWYFVYYDDTDFIYRAWKAGVRIVYTPCTSILHNESSSTGANSAFKTYQLSKNQLYFIRKHRPLFVYILFVGMKVLKIFLRDIWSIKYKVFKAEIRGLRDGLNASLFMHRK